MGGDGGGAGMSLEEAKAVLERAGVGKKDSKSSKKEKKERKEKKKSKKSKKEKKDGKKKDKKRKRDRRSDSDSDSDSDSGSDDDGGRRWKSGVDSGKAPAKGKDKKSKKDSSSSAWGPPPGPDFKPEPISEDDYFMKNHEFAAWLKHVHKTYFTDLLAEKARALFKDFVERWNKSELPRSFYVDGVTVTGRR
jgi:hypothetical protein